MPEDALLKGCAVFYEGGVNPSEADSTLSPKYTRNNVVRMNQNWI